MKNYLFLIFILMCFGLFGQAKEYAFKPLLGVQALATTTFTAIKATGDIDEDGFFSGGLRLVGGVYYKERIGIAASLGYRHYSFPGRSVLYSGGQIRYNFERDIESRYFSLGLSFNFQNSTNLHGGAQLELGLGFPFEIGPFLASFEPVINLSSLALDIKNDKLVTLQDAGILVSIYF